MQTPEQPNPVRNGTAHASLAVALRLATAEAHEAIEALPIMRRLTSRAVTAADYRRYLHAIEEVYSVVETALFNDLDPALRERLGVQPKLPALRRDLAEQGEPLERSGGADPSASWFLDPNGALLADRVIGGLYVLEGATLGGRTIARHLRRLLGDQLGSARFLDFHGEQTSVAWKGFAGALDDLRAEGTLAPEAVIAGALATFGEIHRRLAETAADAVH